MRTREGTRATKQAPITLTPRQEEVMRLLRKGQTNGQIAEALGITLDGAKFHVAEIISKLGASSREEAVQLWAVRRRAPWALPALGWLKWGGIAAGAVAGLGVLVVWATLFRGGSEGEPTFAEPTTTAAGATPMPSPVLVGLVPCPAHVPYTATVQSIADYVDFVNFDGVHYLGDSFGKPAVAVPQSRIGAPFGRVAVNVRQTPVNPNLARADCESARLAAGTILYRIDGYEPHFRIATREGKVYQAYSKKGAKTASEFIDIRDKVTSIAIRDFETEAEIAVITDPMVISALVEDVLVSRVDDTGSGTEPQVRLSFQLTDLTSWDVALLGRIWPGILVSDWFLKTIAEATDSIVHP